MKSPFSNRIACLLFAMLSLASLTFFAEAQDPKVEPKADSKTVTWKEPAPEKTTVRDREGRRELTLRQARRLGLTVTSVRSQLKDLKADGEIDESTTTAEKAVLVLDSVSSSDPKAFSEDVGIDLDELLAFIEKLIDLITRLFPS